MIKKCWAPLLEMLLKLVDCGWQKPAPDINKFQIKALEARTRDSQLNIFNDTISLGSELVTRLNTMISFSSAERRWTVAGRVGAPGILMMTHLADISIT